MILVNLATNEVVDRSYKDYDPADVKKLEEAERDGFLPLDEAMKDESVNNHTLFMTPDHGEESLFKLEFHGFDKDYHTCVYFPTITDVVLCLRLARPQLGNYEWIILENYLTGNIYLLEM